MSMHGKAESLVMHNHRLDPGLLWEFHLYVVVFCFIFCSFLSYILKDLLSLLLVWNCNWFFKWVFWVEDNVVFDGYHTLFRPINLVTFGFAIIADKMALQCSFVELSSILKLDICCSSKTLDTNKVWFCVSHHLIGSFPIESSCQHAVLNPTAMHHSLCP